MLSLPWRGILKQALVRIPDQTPIFSNPLSISAKFFPFQVLTMPQSPTPRLPLRRPNCDRPCVHDLSDARRHGLCRTWQALQALRVGIHPRPRPPASTPAPAI